MNRQRESAELVEGAGLASGYALLAPPTHLDTFQATRVEEQIHWVDYETHPAYCDHIGAATTMDRIRACMGFLKYFLVVVFKRIVGYELIPAHLRKVRGMRALSTVVATRFRRRHRSGALEMDDLKNPLARDIHAALVRDGICVVRVHPEAFVALHGLLSPEIDKLRVLRGDKEDGKRAFIESRATVLKTEQPKLFEAVDAVLADSGVREAVSAFVGRDVRLVDINPQLNDHTDDFWQRIFPDMQNQFNRTAYFHRDASGGDIKAIVYLSDVEEENGPFSYVIGSHKERPSGLADWVAETNDHSGLSATDPGARKCFAALPAMLRRKCAFGNDIPDASDVAPRLVAAEWRVVAKAGHMVIFDTKGIHRGGMVARGERAVVTCILG